MCLSIRISSTLHHGASYLPLAFPPPSLSVTRNSLGSRGSRRSPKWTKYHVCERNVGLRDFVEWKTERSQREYLPII